MVFYSRQWTTTDFCKAVFCIWIASLNVSSTLGETPIMCPIPKLPPHVNTDVTTNSNRGTKASFWCDHSYFLKGAIASECNERGFWDPPTPVCVASSNITCDLPLRNLYVMHNLTEYPVHPGTVVGYKCDVGFILVGPATRYCTSSGNWTTNDPICTAKVSTGRRVASVSENVDFTSPTQQRGAAILDDNNNRCSIADAADRVARSYWKIDLLEKQTIDVVVLIFKAHINISLNLLASWTEDDENPRNITENEYQMAHWQGKVFNDAITTYEYRLTKTTNLRYLTIMIPKSDISQIFLCEVMILSKAASSFGQCWNTKELWKPKNSLLIANGTCFTLIRSEEQSWENADEVCVDETNGTLASHIGLDEQRLLISHLASLDTTDADKFWIGGHADIVSKTKLEWKWEDGSPIKDFFWGNSQPSMSTSFKPCITMSKNMNWFWDDQQCGNPYNMICKHGILSCGQPDVPANTFVNGSRLESFDSLISAIGTKITYWCPKDFELVGGKERVCRVGGKWSGRAPSCWKKDDPKHPEHQHKTKKTGLPIGAIIAIIAGIILGLLLIIAIVLFISYKKKRGSATMKYSKKSESAETLDVDEKKKGGAGKTNYASTEERK